MTYLELLQAAQNDALMNRTKVACVVTAEAIGNEPPATANNLNRMKWAREVFHNPAAASVPMLWAVLAKNRAMTLANILAITDALLQAAVDTEVNTMAGI